MFGRSFRKHNPRQVGSWIQLIGALMLTGAIALSTLGVEAPVHAQPQNEFIYDEQLLWENWSWGTTVQTNISNPVFRGTRSMGVTYDQAWAGLSLRTPGFDTSPFRHLQFALRPGADLLPAIEASFYDTEGNPARRVQMKPYATVADAGWYLVTIPLEDLDGVNRTIGRVQLQDASGGPQPTFFIDQMGFMAEDGAPRSEGGAVTFTVTITEPGDDADPGDGACADAQGECTLQAAVQEANALDAAVTIHVPSGTYAPDSMMGPDSKDCEPFERCYRLAIQKGRNVHLIGAGATQTVIEGNNQPVLWVLEGADVEIEGVTIRGGVDRFFGAGGGISNEGTLTLHDSTLTDNSTIEGGGGLENRGAATLRNMLVENNQSGVTGQGSGGGIGNRGTMTIESSMVRGNNSNLSGGGIHNSGSLTIRDASVVHNSSGPVGGGGISNQEGDLEVVRVLVQGNTTSGRGGGIMADSGTRMIATTITGNEAYLGGGIYGSATLEGTVVSDNIATEDGGGIFVGDQVSLQNTDVINNTPNDCSQPVHNAGVDSSDSDGTCIPENNSEP